MRLFQLQLQNNEKPLGLKEGLEEFAALYMPARNYAQRTRTEYCSDLEDLVAFLEKKGIGSWTVVGLRDLQHYLAGLDRKGLKASSRKRKVHAVKTFFRFLYQSRYLRENPAEGLVPPTVPHQEPRFLSEAEYEALRAEIDDDRDLAIVEVLLQTGIGLSELANLTLHDLDLPKQITRRPEDVGLLRVRRRGGDVRIPLNWKANETLVAWLAERRRMLNDYLVASNALFLSRMRRPLTPRAIRNVVKKYVERAGILHASVRTLRHTMATHYLAKGGDLKAVQEMLGHESADTTRIYLDLAKRVQRQMVQEKAL